MSELMRFRVARSTQRLPLCEPGALVPLFRPAAAANLDIFFADETGPLSTSETVLAAENYIDGEDFVRDASTLSSGIAELDVWLACKKNRPSRADLISEIGELAAADLIETGDWLTDRTNVANSLVAAMIGDVDPDTRGFLHRLLLVFGLVELLADDPGRLATKDDVYWALRWRSVALPTQLVTLLQAKRSVLARRPGRADMYVVKDEWIKYEAGEIAHIENVLPSETKTRELINLTETEQTTTTDTETFTSTQRDSQTTNRFNLHDEASTDTNLAIHIDGKVDVSGQYGPAKVDAHVGGSLDYSVAQSTKHATDLATESIARAVTKVEERVREIRTLRSLTRTTETDGHSLVNPDPANPIVGIYRWVEKVQRVQIFRYPNRFLLEFEIPEPGAWWRWLEDQGKNKGLLTRDPGFFTLDGEKDSDQNPQIRPADISSDPLDTGYYQNLGSRYATMGIVPPPQDQVVAIGLKQAAANDPENDPPWIKFYLDSTLPVPAGSKAVSWNATVQSWHNGHQGAGSDITISVGAGPFGWSQAGTEDMRNQVNGTVGHITGGTIPIAVMADSALGFAMDFNITCEPTEEAIMKWQISTYDLIAQAYYAEKRQHDEEIAARSIRHGVEITGNSPERNKEIVYNELKRLVIEMLTGTQFKGRPALIIDPADPAGVKVKEPPMTDLMKAGSVSSEIQFLEQAFEWENLTYVLYSYYWANEPRWQELADIQSEDAEFDRFRRAGSARVVVPARPGFDEQVNIYTDTGVLWGGGPVPSPEDEHYMSVAEEIRAQQQAPRDGEPGESWEVRLPTTLVWLENAAGLPAKPAADIKLDEPPGQTLPP